MKHFVTLAALAAMVSILSAGTPAEPIREKRVHASEKAMPHTAAKVRRFRTLDQYRRTHSHRAHRAHRVRRVHRIHRHFAGDKTVVHVDGTLKIQKRGRYVGNGWFVDDHGRYDEQYYEDTGWAHYTWIPWYARRQHGYRHYRRQWYLTYLYERAEFNDRHGYHYGYFDRYGFEFDGAFYRYDESYTYQDRLHGKGLFEHRFYRPIRRRVHRRYRWRG